MNLAGLFLLAVSFATTALVSFGGILVMVPEIHRQSVEIYHWANDAEFASAFAVSQMAPGPNIMLMSLIGWRAFGILGLLVATLAIVLPPGILAVIAGRMEVRFSESSYFKVVRTSLPPIVIGLMMASGFITAKIAIDGALGIFIAGGVAVFVALTKHNPLIPILFAIAAGVVAGRFGLLT
jgi:chromate transporter